MNNMQIGKMNERTLVQSMELEEPPDYRLSLGLVVLVVLLLLSIGALTMITPVSEIARSRGELVHSGLPHRIQHPASGRIRSIHVVSGQRVERGDLLVSMDPDAVISKLAQALAREVRLELELERLSALVEARRPEFDSISDDRQLVSRQQNAFEQEIGGLVAQQETLSGEVSQREAEARRYRNQVNALEPRVAALRRKMEMFNRLKESQATSEVLRIDIMAQLAQVEGEMAEARGAADMAASAIQRAYSQRREVEAETQRRWSLMANDVKGELLEVHEQISDFEQQREALEIHSPVSGVVKIGQVAAVNSVAGAGEVIMEIIPSDDSLVVTTLLDTKDIGHVELYQEARIRLDGFDDRATEVLTGRVTQISSSSYIDADGMPKFHATVALDRESVDYRGVMVTMVSGMTADVEIVTGQKSVMEFMLNPITRGLSRALTER